jgi:hypothetical protein
MTLLELSMILNIKSIDALVIFIVYCVLYLRWTGRSEVVFLCCYSLKQLLGPSVSRAVYCRGDSKAVHASILARDL